MLSEETERRSGGTRIRPTLAALVAGLVAAAPGAAQEMPGPDVLFGPEGPAGAELTDPAFGPPGTLIELRPSGLPADHPVQVMIGAVRSGFEVVAESVTDSEGRVKGAASFSVASPDWLETDRAYLVIIADRGYSPLERARFFHPTTEGGTLSRTGRIATHGTCTVLVSEQEGNYPLVGDLGSWGEASGDIEVVVTGTAEPAESCGRGIAIRVRGVQARSSP